MTHQFAIYRKGDLSLKTTVYWDGQNRRAAYTAPRPFEPASETNVDREAGGYMQELNEELKDGDVRFEMLSIEEAFSRLRAAENQQLITEWKEISLEDWHQALNVLPPCKWRNVREVELFFISEALTSTIYSFYGRLDDRCVTRNCHNYESYELLAQGVALFVAKHPTITVENVAECKAIADTVHPCLSFTKKEPSE